MPIVGQAPVVVPEKTYDVWWMKEFRVSSPDPLKKSVAQFQLVPMNSETKELNLMGAVNVHVPDVFLLAGQDADVSEVLNKLLAQVQKIAIAQGKI